MRTSIHFGANTSDFSKLIVCPHAQAREIKPVRTFFGLSDYLIRPKKG